MKKSLRAAMEYLQDTSKRIQRQFYKRWTANCQSLHEQCYARMSRFFIRMHNDDVTMFDECINIMFERLTRLVNMVDVKYARFSNIAS